MFQIDFSKQFKKLLKESYELEMVSGYSIKTLIQSFAAGYTLKPPKPPVSLVDALKDVGIAPTIDAEPVKHGRWSECVLRGGFAEEWASVCSLCGCKVSDKSNLGKYQGENQQLNYCPNCGAKMDGEA
jgi:hypothetical protein